MDEFIGSIDFNEKAELILSSSYLTYQHWIGFIGFLTKSETNELICKSRTFMLSSLKSGKSINSGVNKAKWISNETFLTGTDNGEVMLFKVNKEPENLYESIMYKHEHDSMVLCLAANFNSQIALSGSDDSKIKIWSLNDEISIKTYKGHEHAVCSLSMNPSCSQTFVSCSEDNRTIIWDSRKESPAVFIPHKFNGYPSASSWSALNPNLIAIGSENGQLGIFDIRNMRSNQTFALIKAHDRLIRKIEFNSKKNLIATASEDCKTHAYKLNYSSVVNESNLEKIYQNNEHNDYITDLSWNPLDTCEFLTSSWDGTLKKHLISN